MSSICVIKSFSATNFPCSKGYFCMKRVKTLLKETGAVFNTQSDLIDVIASYCIQFGIWQPAGCQSANKHRLAGCWF